MNKDFHFNNVTFKQLSSKDKLKQKQLEEIADLIYETDEYIYPAFFGDKNNAKKIIPELFLNNDTMFLYDNLYVAILDNNIVGLILWNKGVLSWQDDLLLKVANEKNINIPDSYKLVVDEYLIDYKDIDENEISILNVSVNKNYQGMKIGYNMLLNFLNNHNKNDISLFVLKENKGAINLYKKCSFEIVEELDGFALGGTVRCVKMLKNKSLY